MYVLTDNEDVIIYISETIGYQKNGNPLVDNGTLAIASSIVKSVSDDITIPDGVEPYKYLYKDGAFTENPNYVEPEPSVEEQLAEAQEALRILGYNSASGVSA